MSALVKLPVAEGQYVFEAGNLELPVREETRRTIAYVNPDDVSHIKPDRQRGWARVVLRTVSGDAEGFGPDLLHVPLPVDGVAALLSDDDDGEGEF